MRFCNYCESTMTKQTSLIGITFHCRCQNTIAGEPNDTLMIEEFYEVNNNALKHEVFIDNAPFDLAANIVLKDCPNCNINYMVMVVPDSTTQISLYVCGQCGYKATHEEYVNADMSKTEELTEETKESS